MNTTKSAAIFAAMLITAAGMTGIANYSNAAADSARDAGHAAAQAIITLPTIQVAPSPEQLRALRDESNQAGTATAVDARMPYYSFASDAASA